MLRPIRSARELSASPVALPLEEHLTGKLVEVSGGPGAACRTLAVSVLRRAQLAGETTVWIQPADGSLYPPDLHDAGVDLDALVVVNVPPGPGQDRFRAAEMLLRSGAFGLVVLDAQEGPGRIHPAWQGRLLGAAREHRSRVLFLTGAPAGSESVGSLVGLRVEPRRIRVGPGTFVLETRVLKNKHGLPLDDPVEHRRGPWGLG